MGLPTVKRSFDIVIASGGLLALAPFLGLIGLLVRLFISKRVIFSQARGGINGTKFWIYKFTTMLDSRNEAGELLPDSERMTGLGWFLRITSLDELPELWNVLKGEMSLVGPRPLIHELVAKYTPAQRRRLEVVPGITGLAQVNGRNQLSLEERYAFDVWYIDNWSLLLDLRILILTVPCLLKGDGATKMYRRRLASA